MTLTLVDDITISLLLTTHADPDRIPGGAIVAIVGAPVFLIFMFTRWLIREG